MKTIAVVSILALFVVPVFSGEEEAAPRLPYTVAEFVSVLEAEDDPVPYVWVAGYLWGADAALFVSHDCYIGAVDGVTNKMMGQVFIDFANKNKDSWEKKNAVHFITVAALLNAFPCPVEEKPVPNQMDPDPPRSF